MVFQNDIIAGASGAGGYSIDQSIRFNNDDSSYLTRTPSSAGNRRTYTYSVWLKRGDVEPGYNMGLLGSGPNKDNRLYFRTNTALQFVDVTGGAVPFNIQTNAVLRDPSSWYHVVLAVDTTDSTASNRVKIYINGTLQTSLATASYPTQNLDTRINTTDIHYISKIVDSGGATEFDGYMAEINFIDGQQLDPTSFGEVNSNTGQWIAKEYSGSYGTNGFYITGENSVDLGADYSGNNNDWTSSGLAANDQMSDSPTNNWCVLNSVSLASTATLSDGNLTLSNTSTGATTGTLATPSSGKWYFEIKFDSESAATTAQSVGVVKAKEAYITGTNGGGIYFFTTGLLRVEGVDTGSWGSAWGVGDTIGVAIDLDANKIWFAINNTWQASGNPSAGTNPAASGFSSEPYVALIRNGNSSRTTVWTANFGQNAFAYTPPTNFLALNTDNLPAPTIVDPSAYFQTTLYTGNGSTQEVNQSENSTFNPSFVWIKLRTIAANHELFDQVRGATKALWTNSTAAETTDAQKLQSFDSDGFTVGTNGNVNGSGYPFVAWQWNEGATPGFDIVSYSGTGVNRTVAHNLGVKPGMFIVKQRGAAGTNWGVYHSAIGATKSLFLQSSGAAFTSAEYFNNTEPTSSVFTLGTNAQGNANGGTYIAYVFAPVEGFSAFGSYVGNGNADGPMVNLGFQPSFIMLKDSDNAQGWAMYDTKRGPFNPVAASGQILFANLSSGSSGFSGNTIDIVSNGFKVRAAMLTANINNAVITYAAFAENPFKTANAR